MYEVLLAYAVVLVALSSVVSTLLEILQRILPLRTAWLGWNLWWLARRVGRRGEVWGFLYGLDANESGNLFPDRVTREATLTWLRGLPPVDAPGEGEAAVLPAALSDEEASKAWWAGFDAGMSRGFRGLLMVVGVLLAWIICGVARVDAISLARYLREEPAAAVSLAGFAGEAVGASVDATQRKEVYLRGFEARLLDRLQVAWAEDCAAPALGPDLPSPCARVVASVEEARAVSLPGGVVGDEEDVYAEAVYAHFRARSEAIVDEPARTLASIRSAVDRRLATLAVQSGTPPLPAPVAPAPAAAAPSAAPPVAAPPAPAATAETRAKRCDAICARGAEACVACVDEAAAATDVLAGVLREAAIVDGPTRRWVRGVVGASPADLGGLAATLRGAAVVRAALLDRTMLGLCAEAAWAELVHLRDDGYGLGGLPRSDVPFVRRVGELLMALLISAGAPYWFDLVNRLVNRKPASP